MNSLQVLVALISLNTAYFSFGSQVVELSGSISDHDFKPDGKTLQEQSYTFTLNIAPDGRWQIRTDFNTNHYYIIGCDGTNVASYLYDMRSAKWSTLPGEIVRGTMPVQTTWYVTLPWLVYASQGWLATNTDQGGRAPIPAVWSFAFGDPIASIYRCSVERDSKKPYTPSKVEFLVDPERRSEAEKGNFHLLSTVKEFSKDPWILQAKQHDFTATEAEFTVTEYTNVMDLHLPLKFQLLRFFVPPSADPMESKICSQFEGSLKSVQIIDTDVGLPKAGLPIYVTDFRLKNETDKIDIIKYFITNSAWKADSDPQLNIYYKKALSLRPHKIPVVVSKGMVLVVFVAVIFGIPAAIFGISKQFRSKKAP